MLPDDTNPFADPQQFNPRLLAYPQSQSTNDSSTGSRQATSVHSSVATDNGSDDVAILNDDLVEEVVVGATHLKSPTNTSFAYRGSPSLPPPQYIDPLPNSGLTRVAGYYGDFDTIDWVKDITRDRCRHRSFHAGRKSILGSLRYYWDSGSGWFCVLLVGLITGVIACLIDIGSTWMSDMKEGVCAEAFWFNREQCCWSSNETDNICEQWHTWSQLTVGNNPTGEHPDAYFIGYLCYLLFALLFASVCVLLVRMFAPYACGSGIPEIKTILSGFIIHGYLGKWTLLIKTVGMILGVAAGLSLGKEGPMVHMASCVGNVCAYLFPKYGKNEAKKREILSASAAAGVAVAFGAPIGGVLFSLEEASYYFPMKTMFRSFFCAMVAANVLRMMNPYGSDTMIMFYLNYKAQWHVMELFPFALLGLLGGIFGTIFNRANLFICRLRKSTWLGKHPIREVLIVTAITALLSFPHPYLRMNASELIRLLVSRCSPDNSWSICDYQVNTSNPSTNVVIGYPAGPNLTSAMVLLVVALFVKLFLTVFTFGIKVPTGLFIPSLAAGAIMGRMLGVAIEQLVVAHASHPFVTRMCKSSQPCINPGLYAMIGAAATLGGVTRMTISLVVVMLELTGGLNYIIPLMVAAMISKWTGDRLTNGSIYEEHIRLNDYPYLGGHDELEHTWVAADVMQPSDPHTPLCVLTQNKMIVKDVELLLNASDVKGFPVVVSQESPYLVGWVTRRDLQWALDNENQLDTTVTGDSPVYFTTNGLDMNTYEYGGSTPIFLQNIVDLSPTTVTDQTHMDTVLDFFRKLGLRQILVTHNGCLLGILTKKDILQHVSRHSGNM